MRKFFERLWFKLFGPKPSKPIKRVNNVVDLTAKRKALEAVNAEMRRKWQ